MKIESNTLTGRGTGAASHHDSDRFAPDIGLPIQLKSILVPVDFSDCSKKALQYAIPFAAQFHARLILLNIIPVSYIPDRKSCLGDLESAKLDLRKNAVRRLTALAKETVPDGIFTRIESRCGVKSLEIVGFAKEVSVDLIIISTHGRTGRAHALAGSVAEYVVQLAPCPVLVVREHEHEFIHGRPSSQPAATTTTA